MAEVTDDDLRRIVLGCDDRCQDPDIHDFFVNGGGFVRRWSLTATRPADRSFRTGLNRYPHNVIGAYVIWRGRGLTLNWKGSRLRPAPVRNEQEQGK